MNRRTLAWPNAATAFVNTLILSNLRVHRQINLARQPGQTRQTGVRHRRKLPSKKVASPCIARYPQGLLSVYDAVPAHRAVQRG